jgi:N-acyl-L-homoserine lactone synthetase
MTDGDRFPYRVVVVHPGEHHTLRRAFQWLRYQEFVLRLKFEPENASGLERDEYDPASAYALIVENGEIRVGCRLIDGEQVPITINRDLLSPGRHFEISRMVCNSQSSTSQALMCSLYAGVARYAFEVHGYHDLYCDTRYPYLRVLRPILGDTLQVIGSPQVHDKNGQQLRLVPTRINCGHRHVLQERLMARVAPMLEAA